MSGVWRIGLVHVACACWAGLAIAQTVAPGPSPSPSTEPRPDPLRVLVAGNAPFVELDEGGEPTGISVRVWQAAATQIGARFRFIPVATVPEALERLARGEGDVAIGPITITSERAEQVLFTQPYYESSLGILAPASGVGFWQRLRPFLSGPFLGGATILLLVLLGVGFLLWMVERQRNDLFPRDPVQGTGVGVWLALVTMTTVGYGDKVPITPIGRVVASVWMLISMLTVSSLTAFLATALTVASLDRSTLSRAEDLVDRRVAAVEDATGAEFARRQGARIVEVDDVSSAIEAVMRGAADAVVHDRPMLLHELAREARDQLVVSRTTYQPQDYGFAVEESSPLAARLDVALLELRESGQIDRIVSRELGSL